MSLVSIIPLLQGHRNQSVLTKLGDFLKAAILKFKMAANQNVCLILYVGVLLDTIGLSNTYLFYIYVVFLVTL
jgi:hypothetical protein